MNFKENFEYLMSLSNKELRKEIENSSWNFILQELRYAGDEIERLNKELEEKEAILGGIQQLEAEIERLNNIIEMLELGEKETIDEWKELNLKYGDLNDIRDLTNAYWYGYLQSSEDSLSRIRELKELKENL